MTTKLQRNIDRTGQPVTIPAGMADHLRELAAARREALRSYHEYEGRPGFESEAEYYDDAVAALESQAAGWLADLLAAVPVTETTEEG